ncbi:MAG: phosphoglucosamine mutase [Actinomycetota bacterium]|nr:phosphoglucosamine mutase [Actinomycetota bacterium]
MGRLFGTDGVRGVAGTELTADLARGLGRAAVVVLGRHGRGRPIFVVGRDTRVSGEWLEDALVEGIRGAGGDVVIAGVQPTPAVAFLTTELGASSGVVISASHNPAPDNGIKFFARDGLKLSDDLEDEIEAVLDAAPQPPAAELGHTLPLGDGEARYLQHVVDAAEAPLTGMTVVVDCANGSASGPSPEVLRRLGATVHAIFASPDGRNINEGCGALHPEVVAAEVVRLGADAGVAHDGDADRALFSDAAGTVIDGDQVLAACAIAMRDDGRLPNHTVVTTVMANLGFHRAMTAAGIDVVTTRVGDRYVAEEMRRMGAMLGGEQSGHVIFAEQATTGDGLLTAVRFLSLAARRGVGLAALAGTMQRFPQVIVNVPAAGGRDLDAAPGIRGAVADAERALGDTGRVVVRASGTEPLVRVMVEAEDEAMARRHADAIARIVGAELGAG